MSLFVNPPGVLGWMIARRMPRSGLAPVSWRGIVETPGQVLGQALPRQSVSPGDSMPGLPEVVPPFLAAMETYDSAIPMGELARSFAVPHTTCASSARRMLGIPAE